jgi:ubiquinone biosynthesis monooxygenase Coq7
MTIAARLKRGETLGDRIMKVNHAGEHGAVCIYTAQRWFARWRAPDMVAELDHFLAHERQHRAIFGAELRSRGRPRCDSYHLCGLGGYVLGTVTGLLGHRAIAATTVAIERVVLEHMCEQLTALASADPAAATHLRGIIAEEQEHHNRSVDRLNGTTFWSRIIDPVVATSTAAVIWLGFRL